MELFSSEIFSFAVRDICCGGVFLSPASPLGTQRGKWEVRNGKLEMGSGNWETGDGEWEMGKYGFQKETNVLV